ncbi:MAG: hypothetical protein LBR30_06970 [Clostridioides sp.]|nr:hypothetical protein [Clostridioides sp.]
MVEEIKQSIDELSEEDGIIIIIGIVVSVILIVLGLANLPETLIALKIFLSFA